MGHSLLDGKNPLDNFSALPRTFSFSALRDFLSEFIRIYFVGGNFMITYEPFWLSIGCDEKVTTYTLIKKRGISSNTLNRMKHNKPISTATLDRLCKALDCDVLNIISYEPDK